jgi:hypothetical protein
MTFFLPTGEHRRIFLALCFLSFIAVAALVAAILVKPAHAEVLALPGSNSGWSVCSGELCQWGEGSLPGGPHIIQVPQPTSEADIAARDESVKKWETECGVKLVRDQYGVMRYTYSKPGCEYGSRP